MDAVPPARRWPALPEGFASQLESNDARAAAALAAESPEELFARALARIDIGDEDGARGDLARSRGVYSEASDVELAYLDIRQRLALAPARDVVERVANDERNPTRVRARAFEVLGLAEGKLRRPRPATAALLEAARHYRALGLRTRVARVDDTLGSLFAAEGRLDLALTHYAMSLTEKVLANELFGVALTLGNMGRVHLRAGRYDVALDCLGRDRELCERLGDRRGAVRSMEDVARTLLAKGSPHEAQSLLRETAERARNERFADLEFFARKDLALALIALARLDEAAEQLDAAERCLGDSGEPYLKALVLAARGDLALARPTQDPSALALLERAARTFEELLVPDLEVPARLSLCEALQRSGRSELARTHLERALQIAKRDGFARYLPPIREAMARLDFVDSLVTEKGRALSAADDAGPDGYFLLEELGRGAFGRTFRAFDPQRHEIVAVKRLLVDAVYDDTRRRRILASARRELESASRVRHPGIARVYAIGTDPSGNAYVVQEFVDGTPLRTSLPTNASAAERGVLRVVELVAHALAALHGAGVVHRDLKPANVLMATRSAGPAPVLIDFGIAQDVGWIERGATEVPGTLEYMSPEQFAGEPADGHSDVYSLGVLAYEWLTGTRPLRCAAGRIEEFAARLRQGDLPRIEELRPQVRPDLAALIREMLQPRPGNRPTAAQVAQRCAALSS